MPRALRVLSLVLLLCTTTLSFAQDDDRLTRIVPDGSLEVGASFGVTKYFGEFTDNNVGLQGSLRTRYIMPFAPEFAFGFNVSHGQLDYLRRYRPRFGDGFEKQFPLEDFPDAYTPVMRTTKVTTFEALLFLNVFPRSQVNFFLFGGYSALSFQVQDIEDDPLNPLGFPTHYPDFRDEDQFNPHVIAGMGFDVYLTRTLSVGASANYRFLTTDLLDGFALMRLDGSPTENDAYAGAELRVSYLLFGDNDADNDGISDDDEMRAGTDPYSEDSDRDGISDYEESKVFGTDPLKSDTDEDGISDSDEVQFHNTNPLLKDTDGDGLSDTEELRVYASNPVRKDSDLDGIDDAEEISLGLMVLHADSDADGIPDGLDLCPSIFGTPEFEGCPPPSQPEIQQDTVVLTEKIVIRDTVVLEPQVIEVAAGQSYTPQGINFETGRAQIRVESEPILDEVAIWLMDNEDLVIEIRGHTDNLGSPQGNKSLSTQRAEAVKEYLITHGIAPNRLFTRGYGEVKPIADNTTERGRARNRRIEFFVLDTAP